MKIIDLLNKIANGEEIPKKIEYRNIKFLYDKNNKLYIVENYNEYNDLLMELSNHKGTDLNYEVEILEEEPRDIEVCGSLFTKSEYDKLAHSEEEKKIPEKLDIKDIYSCDDYQQIHINFKSTWNKINEIINYLKSKGE